MAFKLDEENIDYTFSKNDTHKWFSKHHLLVQFVLNEKMLKSFFWFSQLRVWKSPYRIFNLDESGLAVVQSKILQLIGLRRKKQIGSLTSALRGEFTIIVACWNVSGDFVSPMGLYSGKYISPQLSKEAPPVTMSHVYLSGWIQNIHFCILWSKHFVEATKQLLVNTSLLDSRLSL